MALARIKQALLCMLCFSAPQLNSDVFIWDLGGVLLDFEGACWQLLSSSSILEACKNYSSAALLLTTYVLSDGGICTLQSPKNYLKMQYLQELAKVPYHASIPYHIYSEDGVTPLPDLLKDFLAGVIDYHQAKIMWDCVGHPYFFDKVFALNFDSHNFIKTITLCPTIQTLQACARKRTRDGAKKHCCIILSNLNGELCQLIKEQFATELTPFIDHWIISGDVRQLKPGKNIYELCAQYIEKLPQAMRERIYFIDDQPVNQKAARQIMPTLICLHPKACQHIII